MLPYTGFTRAEDYHQKYSLRNDAALMREFHALYPDEQEFADSTAAARVNGYLGGWGSSEQFQSELPDLGLSEASSQRLLKSLARR